MFVCLSVCLFGPMLPKVLPGNTPQLLSQMNQIFTKLSGYFRIGLLSWLIMFVCVHMRGCVHSNWKCACYFCSVFLLFLSVLSFWSLSKLKMKKTETTLQAGIGMMQLFRVFSHFFPFQSRKSQKLPKCVQKWSWYIFLPLVAKKCNLETSGNHKGWLSL